MVLYGEEFGPSYSSPIPKEKSDESGYLEKRVSKIANLVNRQCQTIKDTLPKTSPKITWTTVSSRMGGGSKIGIRIQ